MTPEDAATEATKTALENAVDWYLHEKLAVASGPIASQKYLTNDNRLIYLTRCTAAGELVPKVKIQVLERVNGGVVESGYQLYADHRLEKYHNSMIFGTDPTPPEATGRTVTEAEAAELLALISALQTCARALV